MNISQRALLAALNAPVKKAAPVEVGWIIPTGGSNLVPTLRNVVKAGKRIGVQVLDNGPLKFFAEEP